MGSARSPASPLRVLKRGFELAKIGKAALDWRRAADEQSRRAAQEALSQRLAHARGLPMKVGQFLAVGGYEAFDGLTKSIAPLELDIVLALLESAWGTKVEDVVSEIEPSQAAASLGQVHRARLTSGESVAIKVRYPDILQHVHSELTMTQMLPNLGPARHWGFDFDSYKDALRESFERELNYLDEAKRQQTFGKQTKVAGLVVPQVYFEWCREDVLVQDWHEGVRLEMVRQASAGQRERFGEILAQTLFESMFVGGLVHADPHPGNYLFLTSSNEPSIVLLDYGATISLSPSRAIALLKLVCGATCGDAQLTVDTLNAIGFDAPKLGYIGEHVLFLAEILSEPFRTTDTFDPQAWNLTQRIEARLGDKKWWFRSAGPADLFLLLRAFHGLLSQLTALGVRLSWLDHLRMAVGQRRIDHAIRYIPPASATRIPSASSTSRKSPQSSTLAATNLKVAVYENDALKVSLAMPAASANSLCDIIPEDISDKLAIHGISLATIQARVDQSALAPQVLFKLEDGPKRYEVWLE